MITYDNWNNHVDIEEGSELRFNDRQYKFIGGLWHFYYMLPNGTEWHYVKNYHIRADLKKIPQSRKRAGAILVRDTRQNATRRTLLNSGAFWQDKRVTPRQDKDVAFFAFAHTLHNYNNKFVLAQ